MNNVHFELNPSQEKAKVDKTKIKNEKLAKNNNNSDTCFVNKNNCQLFRPEINHVFSVQNLS